MVCLSVGTIAEFKEFLFREDLSSQCLTYDTTFEMGLFNLSALTYRQIEFEETPAVPLMLMIHEHNIASVHDFFFARLAEILPDLKSAENVIIITDEEDAVLQALKNHFPDLQRFRCWHRALQDIKEFLKGISITERQVVEEYKSDFVTLLNQETHTEYKSILAQMYLKKWEKVSYNLLIGNLITHLRNFTKTSLCSLKRNFPTSSTNKSIQICIGWVPGVYSL